MKTSPQTLALNHTYTQRFHVRRYQVLGNMGIVVIAQVLGRCIIIVYLDLLGVGEQWGCSKDSCFRVWGSGFGPKP